MEDFLNSNILWFEQLPRNLRPDDEKVAELEKLRCQYHLPNDLFAGILLGSPEITRQVQKNIYNLAKEKMPKASEKELLEVVFRTRIFPQNPTGLKMTEEEVQKEMQDINSLNDLVEYLYKKTKKSLDFKEIS